MKKLVCRASLFAAAGLFAFAAAHITHAAPLPATNHIVIKFKPGVAAQMRLANLDEGLNELRDGLALTPGTTLREPLVNGLFREHQRLAGAAVPTRVNLDRFLYLHLPPGLSVEEAVRQVTRHPWVEYAEPDGAGTGGLIPNDSSFSSQWHHRNGTKPSASIQTPAAWDITQGTTNIIVAVLDSGLGSSAEFTGRLVPGYNFAYGNTNTTDDHGHGTAVAGTLAANGNNGTLVAGVDWRCRVMPVKVLDSGNVGFYSWWAQAVDFAVSNGAKVINLSAGGGGSSAPLTQAITNAIARGVIFVTITHNDGTGVITYPGNLTNCITVGATDAQDRKSSFSNYGPQIDLCAPGSGISTVGRVGGLENWSGTSFSGPQVAGVCGLLAAVRPGITHEQARLLLCAGADDRVGDATDTAGFDPYYGWGRLNAYNSLLLARTRVDGVQRSNQVVRLSWTSPPNASNRQPYEVQFQNSVTAAWSTSTNPAAFTYTTNRTFWIDTNAAPATRFFRVRLRPLP